MKKKLVALMLVSVLALGTMSHAIGKESVVAAEVSTSNTSKTENGITVDKTAHIIPGTVDEVEITLEAYIEGTVKKTETPVDILFILDQSNSMTGAIEDKVSDQANGTIITGPGQSRQHHLKELMVQVLEQIKKKADSTGLELPRVAVTVFNDDANLLQFDTAGNVKTKDQVSYDSAYGNSVEYYERLIDNIKSWKETGSSADPLTGIGGLQSNTNTPAAFTLANEIATANKTPGREQCVIFYSDGKPQLPDYDGLTIPTPEKVTRVLGNSVTKDGVTIDISEYVTFTDARHKGVVQNQYSAAIYNWVQSNEQVDKDALIEHIEYIENRTLSNIEKERISNIKFTCTRNNLRDAMHACLWPMDEIYKFDQFKYDESVKAANVLKANVNQIYSIATFAGIDDKAMHDKDNPNTLTVSYSPKNYLGASRMMQLISSNYKSTTDGGMGLQANKDKSYYDPKPPAESNYISVIETNPATLEQQTKDIWVSPTGQYKLDGDETQGDKRVSRNANTISTFTHYYDVVETPERNAGNFYTNAVTVDTLYNTILGNISNIINGHVTSESHIDETAIITDYLSEDFVLPEGITTDDVEVYISKCKGQTDDGYIWGDEEKYEEAIAPYTRPTVTIENETVRVEGFNFQEHIVTADPRIATDVDQNIIDYYGSKIIIKFRAKAKTEEVWGYKLKTNKPDSGIMIPNKPNDPVITFPQPDVDIYRDYEMKDNVVYLGNKVDEHYIFSDKEESMVNGTRNHNVIIEYTLSDGTNDYIYEVPAGKTLSEGALYLKTDRKTPCTFDEVLKNTEYSCTRTIYTTDSNKDELDKRDPLDSNTEDGVDTTKAHIAVLKPYLPTVDIWIDNPTSKENKPSLEEVCFGNTTGSDDSKVFEDMTAADITWKGKDYLGAEHTEGTEKVSKLPEIEVVDKYSDITDREYSEKDFDIQLREDGKDTVKLIGTELEADKQYDAFPKFKVTYNTYNVEVQKQVDKSDISENMSFLFDGKVTAASDKNHTTDYNVLLRNPDFTDNDKLYYASKKIIGLECTEDVFSIGEDTEWSWMYKLDSVTSKDNVKDINNGLVNVTSTFKETSEKHYGGTFSFEKIAYNEQKTPTIVFTYKNSLKSSTGLYHQISVENHYTNNGVEMVQ